MSTRSRRAGIIVRKSTLRSISIIATLIASLVLASVALADFEIPAPGAPVFIQTSGRLATLGTGDYRTNSTGDDLLHEIGVTIACVPGLEVSFDLFDPEVFRTTAAPATFDEPRDAGQGSVADCTASPGTCEETTFTVRDGGGTQLPGLPTTYPSSAATDEQWVTLATYTVPAVPVPGVDCGLFTVESRTGGPGATLVLNNDDNAWRFRLVGLDDGAGNPFAVEDGPDGIPGTGDELWVGLQWLSYQHTSATPPSCQNFFWFVDDGDTNLFMLNFDMDNNSSVTYTAPDSTAITGTVSGLTVWNDAPAQQQTRPGFGQMSLFTLPGDTVGDAVTTPESGLWSAAVCVDNLNQYSFEVPDHIVFFEEPDLANVTLIKDDGVTTVTTPGSTSYTLTLTNIGTGAAMPLPGSQVELVDQLPAGMTFDSCTVNAPLVGTCTENPGGSGTLEIQLGAQSATVPAYLPAGGVGTVTVNATVDAGLPANTTLTNTAVVDWTDIYGNNYPPVTAEDVDDVVSADLSLTKDVDDATPNVNDTITYTIVITNSGPNDATGVTVTDVLPVGLTYVTCTPPAPTTFSTVTGIWTIGDLANGNSLILTCDVLVGQAGPLTNQVEVTTSDQTDPDSTPNNGLVGEDDLDRVTINTEDVDLSLTKSVNDTSPSVGDVVTFIVRITNNGPGDATGVSVSDPLPLGLEYVSSVADAGSYNPVSDVWSIGDLANGTTLALSIDATVLAPTGTPGEYTNYAQVQTSDQPDPDSTPGDNSNGDDDDASVTIQPGSSSNPPKEPSGSPHLLIDPAFSKAGYPLSATIGEAVTWTLTITNPGPDDLNNLIVTDPIPNQFKVVSASSTVGSTSIDGQIVTISIPVIHAGQTVTVTIETIANEGTLPGEVCNTAYWGSRSASACIAIFPGDLPATGGRPVGTIPLAAILGGIAALALVIVAARRGLLRRIDW